jgi:hypothetical protein
MLLIGLLHHLTALIPKTIRFPSMHSDGGHQRDPGMTMAMIVPLEELSQKLFGFFQRFEPLRECVMVFQRLKLSF